MNASDGKIETSVEEKDIVKFRPEAAKEENGPCIPIATDGKVFRLTRLIMEEYGIRT